MKCFFFLASIKTVKLIFLIVCILINCINYINNYYIDLIKFLRYPLAMDESFINIFKSSFKTNISHSSLCVCVCVCVVCCVCVLYVVCVWYLTVVLICMFLMADNINHFFFRVYWPLLYLLF